MLMNCCFLFSTFVNNSGQNGIVNDGYAPILFSGANRFLGNKGTPLKVLTCRHFFSQSEVINSCFFVPSHKINH